MRNPMQSDSAADADEAFAGEMREAVNRRLDELLPPPDDPPASLHRAMRHAVLGGGKRVRALLCLAAHRLFGNPRVQAALDAACALECLHAYTLVHDDLPALDDDELRRGKPTCHVAFGEATAILAGDALQALAFEILAGCDAPEDLRCRALGLLARTAGSRALVGGQAADLEGEGCRPTGDMVHFIHERKTAALIAASLAVGAVLAGAGQPQVERIVEIGGEAGLAFQIVDDLLDVGGSEADAGKGLRKDGKKGKITYPACFGVDQARRRAHELIEGACADIRTLGDRGPLQHLFGRFLDRVS
jgi:geranylgeranyl pyrophosphate synthase